MAGRKTVSLRAFLILAAIACALLLVGAVQLFGPDAPTEQPLDATRAEDYFRALRQLRPRADAGDKTAQYQLAALHADGPMARRRDDLAAAYFRKAGAQGHAAAHRRLARMYDEGRGTVRDHREAYRHLKEAAKSGDDRAQYRLGLIHARERHLLKENLDEARKWLRRSAKQGNQRATDALVGLRRVRTRAPAGKLVVPVARAPVSVVSRVDKLDQQVLAAYQGLGKSKGLRKQWPKKELDAIRDSEKKLTTARDAAWSSIPFGRAPRVFVYEPLALAVLDLQIEIRREVGASFHTSVQDLKDAPGCAGSLVTDRSVWAYGRNALSLRRGTGTEHHPATLDLDDIARHVACLGIHQLAWFEYAMTNGSMAVCKRMATHGFGDLAAPFLRTIAPILVLVWDARKHRGERSLSWYWFRLFRDQLLGTAGRTRWGHDNILYLWNRRTARLVGFPVGGASADAIDPERLLDSILDPRAVGFGTCSLAGMVALGLSEIEGDERYACPSLPCAGSSNAPVTEEDRQAMELALGQLWPSFEGNLLPAEEGGSAAALDPCRPLDQTVLQGALPGDDCMTEFLAGAETPWDTYMGCMAEALGGGEPELFAQFHGAPSGRGCGLFDGGEDPSWWQKAIDWVVSLFSSDDGADGGADAGTDTSTTTSTSTGTQSAQPAPADTTESRPPAGLTKKQREEWYRGRKEIRDAAEMGLLETPADFDSARRLLRSLFDQDADRHFIQGASEELERQNGLRECLDPTTCADACSGLGEQVAKANACTEDLLDAILEAAGRPRPQPEPGEEGPPLGPVIIWGPDDGPVEPSGLPCTEGVSVHGEPEPTACGLILCADGVMAMPLPGGQCSCGPGLAAFGLEIMPCYTVRCADDQMPTADCQCVPAEVPPGEEPVPVPPGPGPLDR